MSKHLNVWLDRFHGQVNSKLCGKRKLILLQIALWGPSHDYYIGAVRISSLLRLLKSQIAVCSMHLLCNFPLFLRIADSNSHYTFPDWFFQIFLKLSPQVSMLAHIKKPTQFWIHTTPWYRNGQFWFSGPREARRGWIFAKMLIFSNCFRNVPSFYPWGMGP